MLPTLALRPQEDPNSPSRSGTVAFLLDLLDPDSYPPGSAGIIVYGGSVDWNAIEPWQITPSAVQVSSGFSSIDPPYVFGPEVGIMGWNTTKCAWTDYDGSTLDFGVYGDMD